MDEREVNERLARLEERLSRIEERLGVRDAAATPAPVVVSSVPEAMPEAAPPTAVPSTPVVPVQPPPPVAPPRRMTPPPIPQRMPPIMPALQPLGTAAPPRAARTAGAFETQVGLKWAAWAGAVIVVIGAALGVKYAYDHQWFEAIGPALRVALMSLGGFALLAAGEVVYRRVGALAAAGLFAAGVATLFVVSYAGYHPFNLYERDAAFGFMAVVTLIGSAVAIRGNLVSIGILSIVGGNVAPLVLGGDSERIVPLLAYLLMLQVVALTLAWWGREPKWWTLRGVSLATITLWMIVPVVNATELSSDRRLTVLVFALIYAALFHLELILSSLRDPKPRTTREPAFAVPVPLGMRDVLDDRRGLGVTFSLIVTALLTAAVLVLVWDDAPIVRGAWAIGLGACCLGLGVMLPRFVRGRSSLAPPPPALGLAIGYRIQAAGLLVVTVPMVLSGVWITSAWAVLAVAFAVAGAMLNLGVSRVAAVVVWTLAAAHLGLWALGSSVAGVGVGGGLVAGGGGSGPLATWFVWFGQTIPAYFVLAALLALAGHAVAALVREDWSAASAARRNVERADAEHAAAGEDPHAIPIAAPAQPGAAHNLNYERRTVAMSRPAAARGFQSLAATTDAMAVLAFVAAAFAALPVVGVTFALLGYAWVLLGAGMVLRSPELQPAGLLLLGLAAGKWLLFDTLGQSALMGPPSAGSTTYRPLYNAPAAAGAALFVSGLALLRMPLKLPGRRWPHAVEDPDALDAPAGSSRLAGIRRAAGFLAVLVLLWTATMEINRYFAAGAVLAAGTPGAADASRTGQVAISVFWSAYALGCIVLGFIIRLAGLRYFGLALFAITAAKVVFVDLSTVETGYRILSFLGLGLLLLGTSVLYGKLSPILLRDATAEQLPDPPDTAI